MDNKDKDDLSLIILLVFVLLILVFPFFYFSEIMYKPVGQQFCITMISILESSNNNNNSLNQIYFNNLYESCQPFLENNITYYGQ